MNFIKEISIRDFLAVMFSFGVFSLLFCKFVVPDQIWSAELVILTFFFSNTKPNGNTTTTTTSTTEPKAS